MTLTYINNRIINERERERSDKIKFRTQDMGLEFSFSKRFYACRNTFIMFLQTYNHIFVQTWTWIWWVRCLSNFKVPKIKYLTFHVDLHLFYKFKHINIYMCTDVSILRSRDPTSIPASNILLLCWCKHLFHSCRKRNDETWEGVTLLV